MLSCGHAFDVGSEVQRVQRPHDAVNFDPVLWLADYLTTYVALTIAKCSPFSPLILLPIVHHD